MSSNGPMTELPVPPLRVRARRLGSPASITETAATTMNTASQSTAATYRGVIRTTAGRPRTRGRPASGGFSAARRLHRRDPVRRRRRRLRALRGDRGGPVVGPLDRGERLGATAGDLRDRHAGDAGVLVRGEPERRLPRARERL